MDSVFLPFVSFNYSLQYMPYTLDFYDLQLFNPLVGDIKCYQIEMPMVYEDAEAEIIFFWFLYITFRGESNEKACFFFENDPTLGIHSFTFL